MTQKKRFIIDGSKFDTLKTFYDEVERVLCPNLDFQWGRNMDAFNDILAGGFGTFEYNEPIDLVWKNANKSKNDLSYDETVKCFKKTGKGKTIFDMLIEIIQANSHVNLILE
jgi:RNAse (barnase) inhibitor barstar